MKKLRERLNNKKGFTLVELIVVIVIILILAAVLIPNVMRYIESARKSAFQSEAAGYLTELTGFEAEYFAKETKDISENSGSTSISELPAGNSFTGYTGDISISTGEETELTPLKKGSTQIIIQATVKNGAVTAFGYSDSKYVVNWKQSKGWTNVNESEWKE